MAEYDVFVSYSKKDAPFVRSLVDALEERGVKAWYDREEIRAGDRFMRDIEGALEQSRFFLLVISPDYLSSQWTSFELGVALGAAATREARVISVVVRPTDLAILPAPLRRHDLFYAAHMPAKNLAAEIAGFVKQAGQAGPAKNPDLPDTVKVSSDTKQ